MNLVHFRFFAILVLFYSSIYFPLFAQESTIHVKDKAKRDSLKANDYKYILPFFGSKIQNWGHEMPLPFGLMFNYVHQQSRLDITSLKVGIGDLGPVEMDFVEFDPVQNTANVFNLRADAWIFPFLNIYGIYAHSQGTANIDIRFPIDLNIETTPTVNTFGGGTVLAYGRNHYFGVFNLNLSLSNTSALDEPVFGRVVSVRFGRTFEMPKNPKNKISVSIGAQNQFVERRTAGSITIGEGLSNLDPGQLEDLKNQIASDAQNWYDDLGPAQKLVVDQLVETMQDWLDGKDVGDIPISYDFEKEVLGDWSLQAGIQYQNGKQHWYRLEYGYGKGRKQLLLSYNFRFGIEKKK